MRRISTAARLFNLLLGPTARDRKRPARAWARAVDQIVEDSKYTPDESDRQFAADLGFLIECFTDQPGLTPIGWHSIFDNAKSRMENRLRIRRVHAELPAVAAEPIEAPIFVVGLPRTATTLTHKILARSAAHRGPLMWEMYQTDIETDTATQEARVRDVEKLVRGTLRFSPMFDVIHPVRATQPEESLFILPHTVFWLCCAIMPEYRAWLAGRDVTDDYAYLKQALQVLQYGRDRRRWILKFPGHVAHLDIIREVFPDARIVWTHREPVTVAGSICSLVETLTSLHVKNTDPHAIGEMWLQVMAESMERGRKSRLELPRGAIVDLPYHRLVSDPHQEVPRLYDRLGATWTDSDRDNLGSVLARPIRDRQHEYELSRYGLTPDQVEDAFGDYMDLVFNLNN